MLVVSSPSGAGKTTLTRHLVNSDGNLDLSISVTTRERRPSEVDGVHYHFITKQKFMEMRRNGELLEFAKVHGNFYGTPRKPVEKALIKGRDVLFDIDWQGAKQLYEKLRTDVVSVFVLPPSVKELRTRLERRAEDSTEVIAKRLKNAIHEIMHWTEYDHLVVNRDLNTAYDELRNILRSERAKRLRRRRFVSATSKLLTDLKAMTRAKR
jgi:guanylate kinase